MTIQPDPVKALEVGRMDAVLARFGWEATDDFRRRYWTDAMVYNLANSLVALAEENDQLRARLDGNAGAAKPCLVCGRPGVGARCGPHEREWERARRVRFPQREAYKDVAYRRYRTWMLRTRQRCYLCGALATTVDHVLPLARGGHNQPDNWRPACRPCNTRKGKT